MSSALKNVVESGASTLSDLVDEARSLIEDLPPLANARKKRHRKNWSSIVGLVVVALLVMIVANKVRSHPADQQADRLK
jgi:hypothetical protein